MMKALRYFETPESTRSATQRIAETEGGGGHDKPWCTKLISFVFNP